MAASVQPVGWARPVRSEVREALEESVDRLALRHRVPEDVARMAHQDQLARREWLGSQVSLAETDRVVSTIHSLEVTVALPA